MSQPEDPWSSLAEELGLIPKPAATPPPPPKVEPPRRVSAPPVVEPIKPAAPAPSQEMGAMAEAPSERMETFPAEERGEAAGDEDKPHSRRRRRRRGRTEGPDSGNREAASEAADLPEIQEGTREGIDVAEVVASVEAAVPVEEGEPKIPGEKGEDRTRRRRRRRRKGEPSAESPVGKAEGSEGATLDEEPAPEMDEPEDDGEVDDLSNWSVPAWNDLIAGLYRPPDR